MSYDNKLIDDLAAGGGVNRATLAADLNQLVPIALDGQDPTQYSAGTALNLIYGGKLWKYDSTDVTSAHDGVTVIVTFDSKRFKCNGVNGNAQGVWSVVQFLTAQPASPTTGQVYGLNSAPTGAQWSGHGNAIAICLYGGTPGTWGFFAPSSGVIAFDQSQSIFRSYTGSAWIDGLGASYSTASIPPEAEIAPRFIVQAQQNAPPGSPTSGQYWLVGTSPSGQWLTDSASNKIAKWTGAAWSYYSASTGWLVYNVATNHVMLYSSGAWADFARPRIVAYPALLVRGGDLTMTTATAMGAGNQDFTHIPASSEGLALFPEGAGNIPAYQLAKSTNRLIIKVLVDDNTGTYSTGCAILVDGEVSARAGMWKWTQNPGDVASYPSSISFEFEIAVGDTSSHQYNVRLGNPTANSAVVYKNGKLQFIEVET